MTRTLLLALFLLSTCVLFAQRTERDARDDLDYTRERRDFGRTGEAGQLWFGAGGVLGFSSNGFSSLFNIGVSPMVGYKVLDFLSVGPRVSLTYNSYREDINGPNELRANWLVWEAGLFARARIFRPVFAQVEYSLMNEAVGLTQDGEVIRSTRGIPFLGGGINQGAPGGVGWDLLVLFRLSQRELIQDQPFVIRSGLTWNF